MLVWLSTRGPEWFRTAFRQYPNGRMCREVTWYLCSAASVVAFGLVQLFVEAAAEWSLSGPACDEVAILLFLDPFKCLFQCI